MAWFGKMRWTLAVAGIVLGGANAAWAGSGGQLTIQVVDRDTDEPLACRMHLTNASKRPLKAPKTPFWQDHFVFAGEITLKLPKGEYTFELERGPEYLIRTGHFTMEDLSKDTQVMDLKRFVNMAKEGWWSGDLDVQRPVKDLELLMQAEDLHVVQLVTWPGQKSLLGTLNAAKQPLVRFDEDRYYHLLAGIDARAGGSLLMYNLPEPLDLADAEKEFPPQQKTIVAAKRREGAWVDAQRLSSWDLPIWIACGGLDSVQLANSQLGRKTSAATEGNGKPRDPMFFPGPTGGGRWAEKIYYHLLNCGLHVIPTAGSGSGNVANPLGYNRMYVHVEGEMTYEKWWQSVQAGKVVVTNGPLIRPTVEGQMPGYVFRAETGSEVELEIGLNLATRDRVSYLEVIKNGEIAHLVRLDEWAQNDGKLPLLTFKESGWFLVRAVTDLTETYRFGTTAPYYVEIGQLPRISKRSAQFFLDWVNERTSKLKLTDAKQREIVLKYHRQAQAYWEEMVAKANAE